MKKLSAKLQNKHPFASGLDLAFTLFVSFFLFYWVLGTLIEAIFCATLMALGYWFLWVRISAKIERLVAENAELKKQLVQYAKAIESEKDTHQKVLKARQKAENENTAKTKFLAAVSHEIRTPLNGILGMSGLLADTPLNAQQRVFLDAVRTSGTMLLTLINDILDYSKIEAGHLELHPAETELRPLVEGLAELLAVRAHDKGIDLAVFVDPRVPQTLLIDAERLKQVLFNLIGNAIKFTESGGVLLEIIPQKHGIEIAVSDSGIGIEEAAQAYIFKEFSQADSSIAREFGGTGLGLAITQKILQAMGTKIFLKSKVGEGSRFAFVLEETGTGAVGDYIPNPGIEARNVLIAAPNGPEKTVLIGYLEGIGLRTIGASDKIQTKAKLSAFEAAGNRVDLIILDERLWLNAVSPVKEIETSLRHLPPVFVITSPASGYSGERFQEAGFAAYLVRPVRFRSLENLVFQVLENHAGPREMAFMADPSDQKPLKKEEPTGITDQIHILLVEDNEINALLGRALLEREGCKVTGVASGEEALAVFQNDFTVDLILMDIHMPGLDGIETTRRIRAEEHKAGRPSVPIFALTADTTNEVSEKAKNAGVARILTKPIDLSEIPQILRAAEGNLKNADETHKLA